MADKKKQTKAERREAARQARIEAQRRRMRAKRKKQAIVIGVILALIIAATAFGFIRSQAGKVSAADLEAAGCSKVQTFKEQRAEHIDAETPPERVPYNSNPPTSGQHRGGGQAPWGILDEPVEPELYVHNLEHGAIVIHHKDLPTGQLQQLEDLVDSYPDPGQGTGVILLENQEIEEPIAMTAWTKMQTCERYNEKVVKGFIREHCDKGPESAQFVFGC